MNRIFTAVTAIALLCLCLAAQADVFNMGQGLTSLETVAVGDPGNAADTRYESPGYGAVGYNYRIGKYEVTAAQYTEFLNFKAKTDPYGLYTPSMASSEYGCMIHRSGVPGGYSYDVSSDWANRPVNYVSYWSACRFANWLHNGQKDGDTETGAYTLNGYNGGDSHTISRNPGARWFLPSEDEWYKAAYYKGEGLSAGYWDYPTQSDTAPVNLVLSADTGNSANYWVSDYSIGSPYWRTIAGEFENSPSAYGAFDQGGNVWEWNEAAIYEDWSDRFGRGQRGGSFADTHVSCLFRYRGEGDAWPTSRLFDLGFRVATVASDQPLAVLIDIKPGSDRNCINLRSPGVVPVAVMSASGFDASSLDSAACIFAGATPLQWATEDVNRDGYLDMILHFRIQQLNLPRNAVKATLTGKTKANRLIEGVDSLTILHPTN